MNLFIKPEDRKKIIPTTKPFLITIPIETVNSDQAALPADDREKSTSLITINPNAILSVELPVYRNIPKPEKAFITITSGEGFSATIPYECMVATWKLATGADELVLENDGKNVYCRMRKRQLKAQPVTSDGPGQEPKTEKMKLPVAAIPQAGSPIVRVSGKAGAPLPLSCPDCGGSNTITNTNSVRCADCNKILKEM